MKFINLIKKELEEVDSQHWKLVAILANSKPISIATNLVGKTHPETSKYNPFFGMHAEFRCLKKAPWGSAKNSTLYVFRWSDQAQEFRLAKPCPMCMDFIIDAGVKRVMYSTNQNGMAELKI